MNSCAAFTNTLFDFNLDWDYIFFHEGEKSAGNFFTVHLYGHLLRQNNNTLVFKYPWSGKLVLRYNEE